MAQQTGQRDSTPEEPLAVGGKVWRPGDDGDLVSALVEVERSDADEVKIEAYGVDGGESLTIYLPRRAARAVAELLTEQAERAWR